MKTILSVMIAFFTLFSISCGFAQTPSIWKPTVYKIVNDKKIYDVWGGWFGGGPFIGSTAEDSAKYYCEVRSLGTPISSGEYRSDGRFYFKCPGSSRWQSGIIRGTHSCDVDERVIVIDLTVFTSQFLTCTTNDVPDKNDGCGVNNTGNPCNVSTGNKYQSDTDFSSGFEFTRSYNSNNLVDLGLGRGWRHTYQRRLLLQNDTLNYISGAGRGEPWSMVGGEWTGDEDSKINILETAFGFELTRANGNIEKYNSRGALLSTQDVNGHEAAYAYDASGLLVSVTNHHNHNIEFGYSGGKLRSVLDAFDNIYIYEYDVSDNLASVIYPDGTPGDDTDNPRKFYHYENANFPNHLTGITDENGDRYATYAYDAEGKAIATEHAQTTNTIGQEKIELDYQGAN